MALAPAPHLFDWAGVPSASPSAPRPCPGRALAPARRARRPRPPMGSAAPRPRPHLPLSSGLAAPTAAPDCPPLVVAPGGGRGARNAEAIAAWQRTWIVGLLLRPRRWATHIQF